MVEIENLSYWYPRRDVPALSDVSLRVSPGEFILLVGASGSGKSTLCRAVNGLVPHFYGGRIAGKVKVAGTDTATTDVRDLARVVGMVFQDPESQLISENPVAEVAFGLENIGLEPQQIRKRVEEVLASLRLSPLRDRRVSELSGGEKQKVALASVLAMHPRIIVLDEPTSQLDPISAEEFLSTLKSLNDELGLIVILAEHRVERCFHFADRVVALDGGTVVFAGESAEMASWSKGKQWTLLPPITRLFLDGEENKAPLTVKEGRMRIAKLAAGKEKVPSPIRSVDPEAGGTRPQRKEKSAGAPPPQIETKNLWHVYGDGTEALRGVNLAIDPGEFVAVIGENGSGKTTLVRHFNGLLRPGRGKVLIEGQNIAGVEVALLARTCGMLAQNPNSQLIANDTTSELELSLEAMRAPRESWSKMIDEALEFAEIEPLRHSNPADLSCGERERVALASVLVCKPKILVLDEPTRGVDMRTKERLSGYLRRYNSEGNTVILVTHDMEFAAECCARVLLMGAGRILADGDKHSVLSGSLFFTTQYSKCFRDAAFEVVTREEASRALEAIS
ncbi:MAG: ABC transporter [Candidatus Anoxymicrobium japonicum]|uniref:ABC transporter n=1 Tax=Candidatus Anoxymicrobium japonicum TaxID=2013648 RepID=A0A2N3G5P3_9ACTN|nr:MAG: ABC transporter [Candidatus Anoxymicrobium japonicum]